MRAFADHNPIAVTVYFLCAAGVAMFCMDPVILALSLTGAVVCHLALCGPGGKRAHLYSLGLFLVMWLINPLVSHNGQTVLFVLNHNPITLEAFLYGAAAAAMVVAVLYWFRTLTSLMTSDKLLFLFGALSPRLALLLSMTLRYVPLFTAQVRKVSQAQRALGLYKEDNIIDSLRSRMRIFSVMVTWALENGVITADSMTARGYGVGPRSRFSIFRWFLGDTLLLLGSLLLTALTIAGLSATSVAYYPRFTLPAPTPLCIAGYAAYGLLTLLPLIFQAKEAWKWHCLRSNI